MLVPTALCLAVTLAVPAGAGRPKPPAKAAAPAGDPTVPAPGCVGERLEPAAGRGRAVGAFLEPRTDFQATLFPDGRVLVTGGSSRSATSEWFDPATNRFTPGPALTRARQGHRALLLKDGRLLLLGGTEAPSPAEILETAASAFKPVPEAVFALSAEAVELDEGRVLMVDGASGSIYVGDGRRAPALKGTLNRPRNCFRALRLKDGRVLITGGWPSGQNPKKRLGPSVRPPAAGSSLPVECFNPKWSSLSIWTAVPQTRARHQAVLLQDGRVCLWGGVGQDPDVTVKDLELLDPVKETITKAGVLDLQGGPSPAWAQDDTGQGLYLSERGSQVLTCKEPTGLPAAAAKGRLANGYLGPILVPLKDGSVLVLGAPAFGVALDRWDARTRQGTVLGTLRDGVTGLGLTPDGRVLALGAVVDQIDLRTGAMKPLGWREDLAGLLRTVKPVPPAPGPPPFPKGLERQDALVVPLDKAHALVVGGTTTDGPTGAVDLWDLKKRSLTPCAPFQTRRARPQGLKLADGSVLIWGASPAEVSASTP